MLLVLNAYIHIVVFFPVLTRRCDEIGGRYYLRAEPAMRCYTGPHMTLCVVAALALFVFSVCFPMWCLYCVYVARQRGLWVPEQSARFGFLYRGLNDHAVWYRYAASGMLCGHLRHMHVIGMTLIVCSIWTDLTSNHIQADDVFD